MSQRDPRTARHKRAKEIFLKAIAIDDAPLKDDAPFKNVAFNSVAENTTSDNTAADSKVAHNTVEEDVLPEGARARYLRQACGDDSELLHEVTALLAEAAEGSLFPRLRDVETPAAPPHSTLTAQARFAAGSLIANRYRIVEQLGRGGMGEVYRARDEVLDQTISLKFLRRQPHQPNASPSSEALAPLLEEVRLARRVSHPNVCRVFDVDTEGDETFITMEYVDGEDLATLLRRVGRLPADTVWRIAQQLAAGLAAAHAQGVVHRDLKPANIMLDGQGQVRIADFGTATLLQRGPGRATGPLIGTPAYMAPEQLRGLAATPRSDLYSFGLVIYEALTGRRVFAGESITDYLELHTTTQPTPPSSWVDDVDPELENLILACLEKDPAQRPASALALAAAIPGADPLRLAAEVGITPPPELVAAAGRERALRPSRASSLLLLLAVLQVTFLFLAAPSLRLAEAELTIAPAVLADRAQQILAQLGHTLPAADRAWGFVDEPLAADPRGAVQFWYRQAPESLVPWEMGGLFFVGGQVTLWDPPQDEPGMAQLNLDTNGRLVWMNIVPGWSAPEETVFSENSVTADTVAEADLEEADVAVDGDAIDPTLAAGASTPSETSDSQAPEVLEQLFALAALEPSSFEAISSTFEPPHFADARFAYQQAAPPATRVRAALLDGRAVYFDQRPTHDVATQRAQAFERRLDFLVGLELSFTVGLFVLALVLLRSNLARGDQRGGRRLATFVFAARLLAFLALASHVPDFELEILLLAGGVAIALLEAALAWVTYVALEPLVRRIWPQTLIAWNRLLAGHLRDRLVGGAVLVGLVVGSGWAILAQLDLLAPKWLGLETVMPPIDTLLLDGALGARAGLGVLLDVLLWAIYAGIGTLLLLIFLRYAGRRPWIAIGIFVLLYGSLHTVHGSNPSISWLTLGLPIAATTVLLLVRFGLLAAISALLAESLLFAYPTTLDTAAWYFESGMLGPAITMVLGLLAFGLSRHHTEPSSRHSARAAAGG